MTGIAELNNDSLGEVCKVIKLAHVAEYNSTGLIINTSNITAEKLQKEIENYSGKCLAYVVDGMIVGTMSVFCDEKHYWFSPEQTVKTIKYVAVHPDYQGRRIASQLIEYVKENYSTNNNPIIVSTDQRNKHALKLYEKNGFQTVNITRGKKANSNALRLAWWPLGCPYSSTQWHLRLLLDRLKCAIKIIVRY